MRRRRELTGQSLVEFALIFPILFFLLTGLFDMGRAVFYYSNLSNLVREATRAAIVDKAVVECYEADDFSTASCTAYITKIQNLSFGVDYDDPDLSKIFSVTTDEVGKPQTVTLEVTYLYQPITPGIKLILGNGVGIPLVAKSTMWVEPLGR
jgi:Flp pilus assembly protein TadG